MEILVIEDDPVIGKSVLKGLTEAEHRCTWIKAGAQGLEQSRSQQFDVILLDLMIPEIPGMEILDKIRTEGIRTPVIVLTARGSVEDRVNGLKKGADDYVVKPFEMAELLARIEAVRRRASTKPAPQLEVGDLSLDLSTRRVSHSGVEIELTPTEFSVLEMLMRHAGEVVTRKMLCETLWESDWEGTTNVIEVHINRLRGKLQRGSKEPLIHTIREGAMLFGHLRDAIRTLRVRLSIWFAVAVFCVVGLTQIFVYVVARRTLNADFLQFMKNEASLINQTLSKFPDDDILSTLTRRSIKSNYKWFYEVYGKDGTLLWKSANTPDDLPPPPDLKTLDGTAPVILEGVGEKTGDRHLLLFKRRNPEVKESGVQKDLLYRIGSSRTESVVEDANLLGIMALAMAVVALLVPLGAYILAGRVTRPLAKIISTTARLQPQNLHERLTIRGTDDELDQLSSTINSLLDRIASYIDRHRDFIADAAHELRSPLTAIRSSVEVALNRPRATEEYQTLLSDVMEECTGLATLVNRLLFLAEGDAGRFCIRDQTASLDKVVLESLDMFQAVAETRGIELHLESVTPVAVPGDEFHLRQVVRNLLDNAVKFTPSSGAVKVALRADILKKHVYLTVSDTGAGIPAEDLPRIFDRFYRGDKSRRRRDGQGGYGLGLSICQTIIRAMNGDIKVESQLGRGTTFTVTLPLAAEALAAAELVY